MPATVGWHGRISIGMPNKLVGVLVLIAISMLADVAGFATGDVTMAVPLIVSGLILIGLFVGNDGARTFAIGLSWLNLVAAVALPWFAIAAARRPLPPGATPILIGLAVLGASVNAFTIWSLRAADVRDWMFKRAFHLPE